MTIVRKVWFVVVFGVNRVWPIRNVEPGSFVKKVHVYKEPVDPWRIVPRDRYANPTNVPDVLTISHADLARSVKNRLAKPGVDKTAIVFRRKFAIQPLYRAKAVWHRPIVRRVKSACNKRVWPVPTTNNAVPGNFVCRAVVLLQIVGKTANAKTAKSVAATCVQPVWSNRNALLAKSVLPVSV